MPRIIPKRVTATIEGDFVVFLIGMRVNVRWKVHRWLPVMLSMRRMLRELEEGEPRGFLGHVSAGPRISVQYWRSFASLEAYARDADLAHWPAWVQFNKRIGRSRGDVGIWHETYQVRAGAYECVYSGMPEMGLARASRMVEAAGALGTARGRMARGDQGDGPGGAGAGAGPG
jgi:hypothetical protein